MVKCFVPVGGHEVHDVGPVLTGWAVWHEASTKSFRPCGGSLGVLPTDS